MSNLGLFPFMDRGRIDAGQDLNIDADKNGIYKLNSSGGIIGHNPGITYGIVVTFNIGHIIQMAGDKNGPVYIRTAGDNAIWNNWVKII